MSDETNIILRLPKPQKGRYVAAARAANKSLAQWIFDLADAASKPIEKEEHRGEGSGGDVARERPTMDG